MKRPKGVIGLDSLASAGNPYAIYTKELEARIEKANAKIKAQSAYIVWLSTCDPKDGDKEMVKKFKRFLKEAGPAPSILRGEEE